MGTPYEICLADYECLLPELARVIGTDYAHGSFARAEDEFHRTGEVTLEWQLRGKFGGLIIKLEEYEGYYFSRFEAPEPQFRTGKELLWKAYLAQGGNPDAQEKP